MRAGAGIDEELCLRPHRNGSLPAKVLLYNAGVKLSIKGSDTLPDLQKLEAQGVEILNCGTCLDFFQLTSELGVGSVTNMYEIVQSQMDAGVIIKP